MEVPAPAAAPAAQRRQSVDGVAAPGSPALQRRKSIDGVSPEGPTGRRTSMEGGSQVRRSMDHGTNSPNNNNSPRVSMDQGAAHSSSARRSFDIPSGPAYRSLMEGQVTGRSSGSFLGEDVLKMAFSYTHGISW